MKIKKTIAAIAAAAMVFSSLPMTVLADEFDVVGGDYGVDLLNAGTETEQTPVVYAAVTGVTVSGCTPGGSATMGEAKGNTYVSVQLPAGVVGSDEPNVEGAENEPGRKVYCVRIPVEGLTPEWNFGSGSHYAPDAGNKANNIKDGELLLWLPTRDVTHTINLTKYGEPTKTIYITTEVGASGAAEAAVDSIGVDGTGSVTVDGNNVNVQLTPNADKTLADLGQPENGSGARKNYHIVIPVPGIDPSWTFAADSDYDYDKTSHFEWNISKDTLKLWVPVEENGICTVKLTNGTQTKTIVVKTNPAAEIVTPGPTDAEKVVDAAFNLETGYFTLDFGWVDVNDQGHLDTIISQAAENAGVEGVEISLVSFTPGSNGMVTFTIKYKVGAAEVISDVTLQCKVPEVPIVPETPAPSTSSSSGFVAPPATITTTTITSNTVSTPAQVRTSSKSNITINAAETKVTPAIMKAFTKNKKAKTLTISYGTKMKISIKKSDVKGVSANLDFSVSGKNFLSSKIKNSAALAKAKKITQIDFVKEGKLDGVDKATVQSRVGAKYVGRKATVYEYVNDKLVKVANTTVGGSGLVKFNIDHYGQYVVVVE